MADDVTFTLNADSTPPANTIAATDETTSGPHSAGAQMGIAKLAVSADGDSTHVPATAADGLLVNLGANNDVTITGTATVTIGAELPAGTQNIGDVDIASLPNEGQQTMANSISVAIASNQSILPVQPTRAATSALTTVADNAASVTILASNANRLKALITNDSSARLYLRFEGAAASTANYGVSLAQFETWEELTYTGEIRGIWASDPGDGAARITEFTA